MKKIVVVGGGASGLLAAGQAALAGAEVLLLEKMKKPANKILISGKGRCNITNASDVPTHLSHFNRSGRFLHQAFACFFVSQLLEFFTENGLEVVTERGNRVFPASGRSQDVVQTLLRWLNRTGATITCTQAVTALGIENDRATGVFCGSQFIAADAVVLATGGASYPATGSTGDGYRIAEKAGHNIVPLRPALVPLVVKNHLQSLAGLDLRNIGVRVFVNGKRKKSDFGEVSFTRSGIGGPVILPLSKFIIEQLDKNKQVSILLDLKPALDEKKLDARLQRDFSSRHKEELESVLRGLLPKQLISLCLAQTGLCGGEAVGTISARDRALLRNWLKNTSFEVDGYRPVAEAIVTAGGVRVTEVNPNTMESLKVKGLYLTGELLDIDADTGGYNLQAAFSTGWLAGRSAASP